MPWLPPVRTARYGWANSIGKRAQSPGSTCLAHLKLTLRESLHPSGTPVSLAVASANPVKLSHSMLRGRLQLTLFHRGSLTLSRSCRDYK
jgi:hypothetical protein